MNLTNLESDLNLDIDRSKGEDFTYGRYLALDQIRKIGLNEYPFMVFADNVRGFFSWGVKVRTSGIFSHYMWLVGPDQLASQSFTYGIHALSDYANAAMKFVHNPNWSDEQKKILILAIMEDTYKPWYRTMYDVPGLIGELFGLRFINSPFNYFCSERGKYLKLIDPEYDLRHPTPTELNAWTKARQDRYQVYGRYSPD